MTARELESEIHGTTLDVVRVGSLARLAIAGSRDLPEDVLSCLELINDLAHQANFSFGCKEVALQFAGQRTHVACRLSEAFPDGRLRQPLTPQHLEIVEPDQLGERPHWNMEARSHAHRRFEQ